MAALNCAAHVVGTMEPIVFIIDTSNTHLISGIHIIFEFGAQSYLPVVVSTNLLFCISICYGTAMLNGAAFLKRQMASRAKSPTDSTEAENEIASSRGDTSA